MCLSLFLLVIITMALFASCRRARLMDAGKLVERTSKDIARGSEVVDGGEARLSYPKV